MKRGALIASLAAAALSMTSAAHASVGAPTPGGLDLQPAATEIMRQIHDFHSFLLAIIVAITMFVLALLLWVIVRFNRRTNPTPKRFTHNMLVEVIWTVVPVLILVAIAWKSFPLLYAQERVPQDAEITLKVTGNSWFWNLEYPDQGVAITANLLPEEDAREQNRPYLLATTEPLLVPVDTTVRVLVTSNDVIHAFAVPAFGVKEDAIQGRVNETWFRVDRPGVYYGQCSELCGVNHAYMPIEIRAVSRAEWEAWITAQGGTLAAPETEAPAAAPAEAPAQGEPAAPAQPAAPAAQPTR
ncbi:MAG TPA: cytochrome c oxidase subunit II [Vitreimonas sp.]|uniref:cytochrome c oxidase subunit II n=1 Tax=Vitreimonas sp. TaxID=3069702 RepID=UPI002D482F28|nr:cytochrome c oxidase subunit II [Vitreimonas sp.]HYD87277.1 cytochrome c oxidase subunit II [Vitreimonas sp.]